MAHRSSSVRLKIPSRPSQPNPRRLAGHKAQRGSDFKEPHGNGPPPGASPPSSVGTLRLRRSIRLFRAHACPRNATAGRRGAPARRDVIHPGMPFMFRPHVYAGLLWESASQNALRFPPRLRREGAYERRGVQEGERARSAACRSGGGERGAKGKTRAPECAFHR